MAYPLDVKLEAPKSTKCKRKYCDITGFEAPYVDPKTHLRFYNFKIFYKVKACTDAKVHEYIITRNMRK
jgi:INO80 complex subunit C